jgi:hypothetical protein
MIGFVRLASPNETTVFGPMANMMKSSDDMVLAHLVDQDGQEDLSENDRGVLENAIKSDLLAAKEPVSGLKTSVEKQAG